MSYTTQMDAARQGIVTEEMKVVAEKENIDVKELMSLMAKGQVIMQLLWERKQLWISAHLVTHRSLEESLHLNVLQ